MKLKEVIKKIQAVTNDTYERGKDIMQNEGNETKKVAIVLLLAMIALSYLKGMIKIIPELISFALLGIIAHGIYTKESKKSQE